MSSFICSMCDELLPIETKAAGNDYCKPCKTAFLARQSVLRLNDTDCMWDTSFSFKWLYRLYNGYSLKALNKLRNSKDKPSLRYNGCYKERYMGK